MMPSPMKKIEFVSGQTLYLVASACFGVGLFLHWFLFFAFLCVLPPLHEEIENLREQLAQARPPEVAAPAAAPPPQNRRPSVDKGHSTASVARVTAPSSANSVSDQSATPVTAPRKLAPWGSPTLRIRDLEGNILEVNSEKPVPYESEYFKGIILTMVRTEGGRWEKHFAGKQRKFEVQIQGKMKKLPTGNVMLGGELQEKVEFGLVTRTLISILMRFAAKLLPAMRYSLGEAYSSDGQYECPHIASPLFRTMDRVFVTPEGEEPPELGTELPEPDAERNLRRGGKAPYTNMKFEMGKTYSFSFHSMYLDFGNWIITNVPGYSGLDLKTIVENQSVSVVCYDIPFDPPGKTLRHYANVKKYLTYFEYSHVSTIPESELKEYHDYLANPIPDEEEVEAEAAPAAAAAAAAAGVSAPGSPGDASETLTRSRASTPGGEYTGRDDDSSNDDEDAALTDVPSNSFLPITVLHEDTVQSIPELLSDAHNPSAVQYDAAVWPGVGGKNGFAVVKEFQEVQNLKFIKLTPPTPPVPKPRASMRMWPSKSKKSKTNKTQSDLETKDPADDEDKFWKHELKSSEKIRNGDTILVQSAVTGEYLTIQRGWWLVWTTRAPQNRKGHFIVTLTDHEEKIKCDSSPLYVGFPFRLRSARWPTWQVGLQMSASSTYGGKLLTLYHPPKGNGERHTSLDMSAFTKSMAGDAYNMPKYSSKSVRPLVLSVLPESVCERYSRETVGMIRAVMSTNSVFRDASLCNLPTSLAAIKGEGDGDAPAPPLSEASPYIHSSRVSLPLFVNRDSAEFRDFHNISSAEGVTANAVSDLFCLATRSKKYDELSYQYFPRSLMDATNLGNVCFEMTGWVEVMNRDTKSMQLAYLLSCEIPDVEHSEDYDIGEIGASSVGNPRVIFSPSKSSISASSGCKRARRFTVLRTGAQIFETITDISSFQGPPPTRETLERLAGSRAPNLEKNISTKSIDVSSVLGEPDMDRIFSEPLSPQRDDDNKSDSSDEPSWANNKSFTNSAEGVKIKIRDSEHQAGSTGRSFGVICPRHQGDADHSYQLLAALVTLAQKQEDLLAVKAAEAVGAASSPRIERPASFEYPARRRLLELIASPDDDLTSFFVSDIMKGSHPSGTPGSEGKPAETRKRTLSLHRGPAASAASASSGDLLSHNKVSPLLRTTIVARALWDTHWREEFVQLHASFISFFPLVSPIPENASASKSSATYPGRKKNSKAKDSGTAPSGPACLTLLLVDITNVSLMGEAFSKFPGYHVLKLESLGRVTYLAFNSLNQCESFAGYVLELKSEAAVVDGDASDLTSVEGVMGDPRDSFVLRSARWRPQSRMTLNSRRFFFDIDQQRTESILTNSVCNKPWLISYDSESAHSSNSTISYWELSVRLLRDVAFLSDSGKADASRDENQSDSDRLKLMGTDRLMSFLDDVGALKLIDLMSIDYSSKEALCFFSNIYHTLLLHARLVLGSPTDETWTSFFDTVSYEIGGDIFSLIELEHCVLRGRLSRPEVLPKLGYKLPPLDDDRYAYAISPADPRVNFIINDGSMSGSNSIFVLTPEILEAQLNEASRSTLEFCLNINTAKRSVTLPRTCFLYRNDFISDRSGEKDDDNAVLSACLKFFGSAQSENIGNLLDSARQEGKEVKIRFREADFNSYSSLNLL